MTSGLETFAKVRALYDRTTNPGERAAAAGRMEALARNAGMTVAEAVSKLDAMAALAAQPRQTNFKDIFDTPFFRQQKAGHERERSEKWRQVVAEYGSEEAVFAPGSWERALEEACAPFVVQGETTGWRRGSLSGWDIFTNDEPPPHIVEAVSRAYPLPETVRAAWDEWRFWEKIAGDIEVRGTGCGDPAPEVSIRTQLVERLLDTMPASRMDDVRARLDWFDHHNTIENAPNPRQERVRLATLRADIERLAARLQEQDEGPVQSGHARRTNAHKRQAVLDLLGSGLSDREIARRVGVSPQTVGNVRRAA
ncbi:helix-turn-helix domain-containing protein [Methylobacterium sp. 17Sr1-1]|uniref:helix-turn-helix domain-containing protein n=1 Tax=Methylobacterium sp. 17Sr1-1 TaxID=2202826 RepID=UPI000D7010EA|nr:helix-turn-helix domain-containing protein [Methylobacterium sp. 17Sr1-1]AWN51793.1 hypothetical protein DK412_08945 [Methylobacterium sp. 17Sr1-1]